METSILTREYKIRLCILELLLELATTIHEVSTMNNGYVNHNTKLHLKYPSGRGRYTHIVTRQHDAMIELFVRHKVPYALGNDAPRGGVTGDYIEVSALDLCKLIQSMKISAMLTKDQWSALGPINRHNYIESMYKLGAMGVGSTDVVSLPPDKCDAIAERAMHSPIEFILYFLETNANE